MYIGILARLEEKKRQLILSCIMFSLAETMNSFKFTINTSLAMYNERFKLATKWNVFPFKKSF